MESISGSVLGDQMTFPYSSKVSPNRFVKAPMSELMCTFKGNDLYDRGQPTPQIIKLYETWGEGEIGMLISGNVMVHREHLEAAGNIIVDDDRNLQQLKEMARVAKKHGSLLVGQIGHPGRQTPKDIQPNPVSCSDVAFVSAIGKSSAKPRPLSVEEIKDIVVRFGETSRVLYEAGWDGVEIHAAHGYLLSQFLSPRVNKRTDDYGGSLQNRARIIVEIIHQIHFAVSDPSFIVGIKLNSADFTRDGFSKEDCKELAQILADTELRIDFLDLSGGTYENHVFETKSESKENDTEEKDEEEKDKDEKEVEAKEETTKEKGKTEKKQKKAKSTLAREAFFIEFAENIKPHIGNMRMVVTGGFRTARAMEEAITVSRATDFIGIGRPLCAEPHLCKKILSGESQGSLPSALVGETGRLLQIVAAAQQMKDISLGREPTSYTVAKCFSAKVSLQFRILGLISSTLNWDQVKLILQKPARN